MLAIAQGLAAVALTLKTFDRRDVRASPYEAATCWKGRAKLAPGKRGETVALRSARGEWCGR